jgi:C4-dicarboxylate-specific signal transduction histidine kinase
MPELDTFVINQLKHVCKLTGAKWSAWIENFNGAWKIQTASSRSARSKKAIEILINRDDFNEWASETISMGRPNWRDISGKYENLSYSRIYLFPNKFTHQALLSGAYELSKADINVFKLIAQIPPPFEDENNRSKFQHLDFNVNLNLGSNNQTLPGIAEQVSIQNYQVGITLDQILEHITGKIFSKAAYLAIRRGESFRIQAIWKCLPEILEYDIQISAIPVLKTIINTHQGIIVNAPERIEQPGLPKTISEDEKSWMIIPVSLGQRVIGLAIFVSGQSGWFKPKLLREAAKQVNQIAYAIENAIIFEEATRYLQQLALLNELAATASVVADIDQVSRKVMQRLRRIFNIDWAAVHLLSQDRKSLREYGGKTELGFSHLDIRSGTLIDHTIRTGQPIRLNNLESEVSTLEGDPIIPLYKNSVCELAVPLKYSGQVIGALSLSSSSAYKFSTQDEQLLILIASNLAGLFENMRLNKETQERAEKLQETLHQLKESQYALIQSEKMATAGRLMASIAHEINNPLQAVQNCLHLAGRQELDHDTRNSYLHLANNELTRLMNTVQRMLDYYRPGGVDRKPVNINELLIKTLSLAQKQLDDCGVHLHLNLTKNLPNPFVVGDQIQQVFLNLILNASQAMNRGGHLWIKTQVEQTFKGESTIVIIFQDSGPGIPEKLRPTIFEPFFSTRDQGLGLGLAVSYGIITAHEGNLELIESDETGACFRITLQAP